MLPEFIPYIINITSYIDFLTAEPSYGSYRNQYRIYHIPTKKIINIPQLKRVFYVDESLVSSIALVLEKTDRAGRDLYTIIRKIDDLSSPLWFDYLQVITPQLIIVRKDKKWGVVNDQMQMKCFFEYDHLEEYITCSDHRIFIIAQKNGKFGLLNEDLSIKFPFNYDSITCNSSLGVFVLKGKDSTTIYDIEDDSISKFPIVVNSIKEINEGCIIVGNNRKYCVYDKEEQHFLCDIWFDDIDSFQCGFSLCDRRYILERSGQIIDLGEGQWFERSGVIIYSTKRIQDNEWLIKVYRKDQFLFEFMHTKDAFGSFYCRVIDGCYIEVGGVRDRYGVYYRAEALYDLEGNSVPLSAKNGHKTATPNTIKLANIRHIFNFRPQPLKHYHIGNVKQFEKQYFGKSKYLSKYDDFEIVELEPGLLRLKVMSVDEDGCCWYLVGYIYDGLKMWADVKVSND